MSDSNFADGAERIQGLESSQRDDIFSRTGIQLLFNLTGGSMNFLLGKLDKKRTGYIRFGCPKGNKELRDLNLSAAAVSY